MRFDTAIRETDPRLKLEWDGFYDREGRRMCFRGVNIAVNAKFPPFVPFQESCWWDLLASWGGLWFYPSYEGQHHILLKPVSR
ncbi:MAG: hypothetical protein GYA39_00140 [Methanothrix sp.]|nr:hypothetical protein [Methanothrix sp.]